MQDGITARRPTLVSVPRNPPVFFDIGWLGTENTLTDTDATNTPEGSGRAAAEATPAGKATAAGVAAGGTNTRLLAGVAAAAATPGRLRGGRALRRLIRLMLSLSLLLLLSSESSLRVGRARRSSGDDATPPRPAAAVLLPCVWLRLRLVGVAAAGSLRRERRRCCCGCGACCARRTSPGSPGSICDGGRKGQRGVWRARPSARSFGVEEG